MASRLIESHILVQSEKEVNELAQEKDLKMANELIQQKETVFNEKQLER